MFSIQLVVVTPRLIEMRLGTYFPMVVMIRLQGSLKWLPQLMQSGDTGVLEGVYQHIKTFSPFHFVENT